MNSKTGKNETGANDTKDRKAPSSGGMNRREMVRRLATAVTAAPALTVMAATPVFAEGKPSAGAPDQAALVASGPNASSPLGAPAFLDPHQNETFTVLAERIVPGSTDAGVAQFVDLMLTVEAQPVVKRFVNALSAFDAASLAKYQKPFKDLSDDEQNELLTAASTAKPGGALPGFGRMRGLGPRAMEGGSEEKLTMRDHFELMKSTVSEAYFSSEAGMKYLGWTGQVMWSSFPGCTHSDHS